jgi:hypothetical protein
MVLVLVIFSAHRANADSFWIDQQETENLRLLYFDPFTTYLVPHVTRSFENSLEFQRYIFD